MVFDAPQLVRVALGGIEALEPDGLVADDAGGTVDGVRVETPEPEIRSGSDDKKGRALGEPILTREVQVTSVHDIKGAGLWLQLVEDIDIVQLAIGDMDKRRNIAAQIQQRMELDRRLGSAKAGPGEDGQA